MKNRMLKKVLSLLVVCVFSISNLAWGVLEDSITATAQVKDTITNGIDVVSVEALQSSLDSSVREVAVVISSLGLSVVSDVVSRNTISEAAAQINVASVPSAFTISAPRQVAAQSTRQEEASVVISGRPADQIELSEVPSGVYLSADETDNSIDEAENVEIPETIEEEEIIEPNGAEMSNVVTCDYESGSSQNDIDNPDDAVINDMLPSYTEDNGIEDEMSDDVNLSGDEGEGTEAARDESGGNSGNRVQMQLLSGTTTGGTLPRGPDGEIDHNRYFFSHYDYLRNPDQFTLFGKSTITIKTWKVAMWLDLYATEAFQEGHQGSEHQIYVIDDQDMTVIDKELCLWGKTDDRGEYYEKQKYEYNAVSGGFQFVDHSRYFAAEHEEYVSREQFHFYGN